MERMLERVAGFSVGTGTGPDLPPFIYNNPPGEAFGLMVAGARFELWTRPLRFDFLVIY
jgi:hypothetical protein